MCHEKVTSLKQQQHKEQEKSHQCKKDLFIPHQGIVTLFDKTYIANKSTSLSPINANLQYSKLLLDSN